MTIDTRPGARAGLMAQRVILGAIAGGAAAIGITELVFLVMRIIPLLTDPIVTLVDVPLLAPVDVDPGGAASAAYTTLTVGVEGLGGGARAALVAAAILRSLVVVTTCAAVAWLSVRVFLNRPFVSSATWGIGAVALAVIISGFISPALTGIANAEAALLVGGIIPDFLVTLDLAPIGWGLALSVVGAAFELGQRLQRDTDGLV